MNKNNFVIDSLFKSVDFQTYHFSELTTSQLYEAMRVRQIVFVVEQDCPYIDADGKDMEAYHVFGRNEQGVLVAYTRLLAPGMSYPDYASIGRVVNMPETRGKGVGKALMLYSISECSHLFPDTHIKISAQTYLKRFYTDLGFVPTGDEYLEDGIPHLSMTLNAKQEDHA